MPLKRLASVWLGGCSGCHMSFLDMDEWLIELAGRAEYVYGPFCDAKEFPENVDIVLIEGALSTEDHPPLVRRIRERSRVVVAFGDCAVTGNVTAMRNPLGVALAVLGPVYGTLPRDDGVLPPLLDQAIPVHMEVPVEFHLPGCPPRADRIRAVVDALLDGRKPHLDERGRRFG
jgi:NAD-reducing hydrogenase small subunit